MDIETSMNVMPESQEWTTGTTAQLFNDPTMVFSNLRKGDLEKVKYVYKQINKNPKYKNFNHDKCFF